MLKHKKSFKYQPLDLYSLEEYSKMNMRDVFVMYVPLVYLLKSCLILGNVCNSNVPCNTLF